MKTLIFLLIQQHTKKNIQINIRTMRPSLPSLAVLSVLNAARAMDMPDESGNSPNWNLSLSDPNCIDESCEAFLNAENDSQAQIPFASQFLYGHWVTYYYVVILGLLMLGHITRTVLDKRARPAASQSSTPSLYQRANALRRSLSYRTISTKPFVWLDLPAFGVSAFLLLTIAFLAALVFAVKPYYRQHMEYGSPPMAIRAGLMAFACTPILIACMHLLRTSLSPFEYLASFDLFETLPFYDMIMC